MRYAMIRTEDLSKTYRGRLGVKGITLEVEPGEIFGYLGPDGAGKTTTIRLLLDFIRPTSGHIQILGLDHHLHSVKIRSHVGYLPGEFTLYDHLTGEKVLRYLSRLRGGVAWQDVINLVERFDLNIQRKLNAMSASDKCKLGLVQAFMHRPDLLILDDPSRALNAAGQAVLYDLLFEARSDGRSIFLASSSLTEMERIADRVAILYQGELLAIERGVQLRSRALRRVEMRFATPIHTDIFNGMRNLEEFRLNHQSLSCMVRGDPDNLIKTANQYRLTDFVSQALTLDEAVQFYYGVNGHVV
ncbi:MAG TPA: ATP-binding cassette domain-containing protein [Levilinea sp.]|nr:ATP-binding cassette domain-containing protein [Levilinea sp.]